MTKKESGVKKWNHAERNIECFSQNRQKTSFEYGVRLKALMQIMENPATWLLYPNMNFVKALRM